MNRIIFFGSAEFALTELKFAVVVLEKLCEAGFPPVLVVTTPDAPVGREQVLTPSPVKVKAKELGLEVFTPEKLDQEAIAKIKSFAPEVGISVVYGKIIPKELIEIFSKRILNIHPSLLPRFRGPTPIQSAILAGEEKTGVTIMLVDEEVDHGPILAQREFSIFLPAGDLPKGDNSQFSNLNYNTLHDELVKIGVALLLETLPRWLAGEITSVPQDHSKATFTRKFTREDGKINWQKSAEEIDRQIRALNPEPSTWTEFKARNEERKILKIIEAQPLTLSPFDSTQGDPERKPNGSRERVSGKQEGEVFLENGELAVRCKDGSLILKTVQPEGKKPMTGQDFLRGHREIIGKDFS